MTFPTLRGRTHSNDGQAGTTHTISLPSGISNGDHIAIALDFVKFSGASTGPGYTVPSGYSQADTDKTTYRATHGLLVRIADGTEGTTLDVECGDTNCYCSWAVVVYSGCDPSQMPEGLGASAESLSADAPSLSPTGGAKDYAIAWMFTGGRGIDDTSDQVDAAPTNYGNLLQDSGNRSLSASAYRTVNTATEDPAAAALSVGAGSDIGFAVWTVAFHPAPGGITQAVGQTTETDSSFSISNVSKGKAVGFSSETDSVPVLSISKNMSVGQSTETDSVLVIPSPIKSNVVGITIESDQSFPLDTSTVQIGLASESDSAFATGSEKLKSAVLSTETDSAFAIGFYKNKAVGISVEVDGTLSLSWLKEKDALQVTSEDSSLPVSVSSSTVAGQAQESDSSFAVLKGVGISVGISTESDNPFSIAFAKSKLVGISQENETSQIVTRAKRKTVSITQETDSSFSVSTPGVIGLAEETDLAFPVLKTLTYSVGMAQESSSALSIQRSKQTPVIQEQESNLALPVSGGAAVPILYAEETDSAFLVAYSRTVQAGLPSQADVGLAIVSIAKEKQVGISQETDSVLASLLYTNTLPAIGNPDVVDLTDPLKFIHL